ncbi:hypothetical protein NKH77_05625 [Streptomyces sp. M19]
MTRTVADAALLMSVVAAPDDRDHTALPPAALSWQTLEARLPGTRIGLFLDGGAGCRSSPPWRGP